MSAYSAIINGSFSLLPRSQAEVSEGRSAWKAPPSYQYLSLQLLTFTKLCL